MGKIVVKQSEKLKSLIAKSDRDSGFVDTRSQSLDRHSPIDLWLQITDFDGAPGENQYVVDLYATPYSEVKLYSGSEELIAWNVWEKGNSESHNDGYTIVPEDGAQCDDIIGVEELNTGVRYRALAHIYRDDAFATSHGGPLWGYVFSERRDPIIKGPDA